MLNLAEEVIELTNSTSEIEFQPIPKDDPKLREPDISLAKSLLAWNPRISRKEGLKKTISYFDEAL